LFPRNLQWFEALSKPYRHDEADATPGSSQRIAQLIELHAACDPSAPPTTDQREQAYRLAKTLPHFDRDLTAFYYYHCPSQPDDGTPAREYDLHVAHSIMRLEDPPDLATLRQHCAAWRDQGLVHVLSVAAMHMPTLADWFPLETAATPLENRDEEACSLLLTLEALRTRPKDYAHVIQDFIDTQDPATPTAQAIATTLDRLAILMSVKSNADAAPGHDLAAALASFPRLETLEAQDLWCRIKPTLEQAMPPSILRVDPRSACIRKRVKRRSSSSSTGAANTTAAPGSW
jgi:hypothetical protein